MRRALLIFIALSPLAAVAAWLGAHAASAPPTDSGAEPMRTDSAAAELIGARSSRARAAVQEPAWDDAVLIAALGRLGQVRDLLDPGLEGLAQPILVEPARVLRSLELLRGTKLIEGPGQLSSPERGAVLALGLAAATYGRRGGDLPERVRRIDRHRFVVGLIEALPDLRPPVAVHLVRLIERLRLGGRPVVGAGFFQVVLELRRAHPDLRELLDHLLEECAAELPGEERRAIATLFVQESEDALLVKVAFVQLLGGAGSEVYLALARERLSDEQTSQEIRTAILEAVASAASTDEALDLIAPHLDVESVNALFLLADREGGAEALIAAYDARLTGGLAPEERRWLVAGLEDAGESELLFDIARTDPDRAVRGQAMLSVSLGAERPTSEMLDAVLAGRDQPEDPFIGLDARHSTLALTNLALRAGRAGDGQLEQRALDETRAVVLSDAYTPRDRRFALGVLARQLPAEEFLALQARLAQALERDH